MNLPWIESPLFNTMIESKNLSEKFFSELNRILLQIANNISKLNETIALLMIN